MGTVFTYQGRLIDANGPADGLYDFQFKLFDANVAGTQQGSTIDINDLDVIDGHFVIELDFGSGIFDGAARWLDIGVRPGANTGSFTTLSPRIEMTPVPYALQTRGIFVDNAYNVGIGTTNPSKKLEVDNGDILVQGPDSFVAAGDQAVLYMGDTNHSIRSERGFGLKLGTWGAQDGITLRETTGNVGIGTTIPGARLDVVTAGGDAVRAVSPSGNGVSGENTSSGGGKGILGGGWYGVYGQSDTGHAIHGKTTSGYAGYFEGKVSVNGYVGIGTTSPMWKLDVAGDLRVSGSSSTDAYGQYGVVEVSDTGTFVAVDAETSGNQAVRGRATATGAGTNYGGYFEAYKAEGQGVAGVTNGSSGRGVYGEAGNTGNVTNYGGYFKAHGQQGQGVYGEASGSSGRGVRGVASGSSGQGVQGYASNSGDVTNYGGYFVAAGGSGRGVYGSVSNTVRSAANYGGYFKADDYGVYGEATDPDLLANFGGYFKANAEYGRGVEGEATGDSGYGVFGRATGSSGKGVVGNGVGYDFYAQNASSVNFGGPSSIRWKTNIRSIDNPLEKVLKLRGVYFNWDAEHGGEHDMGMIAEEVGEVLPEIVGYEENGIDATGMDYGKLTPLLVESIKELKRENNKLEERIEALERTIHELAKVKELEL
jgi:hypothetical protein